MLKSESLSNFSQLVGSYLFMTYKCWNRWATFHNLLAHTYLWHTSVGIVEQLFTICWLKPIYDIQVLESEQLLTICWLMPIYDIQVLELLSNFSQLIGSYLLMTFKFWNCWATFYNLFAHTHLWQTESAGIVDQLFTICLLIPIYDIQKVLE